jgi:hypothetical protein
MAPGPAQARQIFIDELVIADAPEAWEMAAMHDAHRQ